MAATIGVALALLATADASALTLQPVAAQKFDQPTYVTSEPGNPDRLLVVERGGTIQLVDNGVVHQFADLSSEVGCPSTCAGERGLLSIALDPNFSLNGRLYVDFANNGDGTIHVDELLANGPGHETAALSTLRPLLEVEHSVNNNHNGGQLQFGPEGDLFISTGDGGGSNDELHNAQDLSSPLGKILRIDPDPLGPAPYYTVPASNPYATGGGEYKPLIWNYGLRNPYRFSFDQLTGDMVIADVGQSAREEIDFAPKAGAVAGGAGANYGWNCREGFIAGPATDLTAQGCATTPFVEPVFDYTHTPDPDLNGTDRCSIIGGYVVRDPSLGSLDGHYLYADYCAGAIRALQLPAVSGHRASGDCYVGLKVSSPVSFGEDSSGRVYVVEQSGGVYRISGSPSTCPSQTESPPPPAKDHPSFTVGLTVLRRGIERGNAAQLTAWISPCNGRKGQEVRLLRNGHRDGSKFLSRACTVHFSPRVRSNTTFSAQVPAKDEFLETESRQLKVRVKPRRHLHHD